MTPEQIELPTVSNVDQDLQREPDIREGYVLVGGPVKWVPYKPQGTKQMKRKGRWKAMNEYGGWDNCETPAQIWSGFISYEDMAAHIIAQREQIEAQSQNISHMMQSIKSLRAQLAEAQAQAQTARGDALREAAASTVMSDYNYNDERLAWDYARFKILAMIQPATDRRDAAKEE
jgi:hypothetical protein